MSDPGHLSLIAQATRSQAHICESCKSAPERSATEQIDYREARAPKRQKSCASCFPCALAKGYKNLKTGCFRRLEKQECWRTNPT